MIFIHSARVGAPACGDVMRLQVKIKDGVVEDVKFRTFGCGSAIASSSYATEWLQGKTIDEALSIKVCSSLWPLPFHIPARGFLRFYGLCTLHPDITVGVK